MPTEPEDAARSRIRLLASVMIGAAMLGAALTIALTRDDAPATPKGLVVTGPGVRAAAPPFAPDYTKLPQRIRLLGLPPTGKERYHLHALLRIYRDGLLVPVPAFVGYDEKRGVVSSIHTHDATGVVHFESDKPFPHTLGNVFAVWGVTLGPGQLGSLKNGGGRTLRVYFNGRRVSDPAAQPVAKNDVIVMRFDDGSQDVPLNPDTTALKDANAGKGLCGSGKGKKQTSCIVKKPAASS